MSHTTTMMSELEKQVGCGPPLGHWESLYSDVRGVVLSKVPLRDLALAAGTCREFRGAFRKGLGEERERLMSVAEAKYGKDVVSGFVTSVQDDICCSDPYYYETRKHNEYIVVDAAGEPEVVTDEMVVRLLQKEGCVATFWRGYPRGIHALCLKRGDMRDDFTISVRRTGTFSTRIEAEITRDDGEAEVGILLAICTREHEPVLSHARRHSESPKTAPAAIWGPRMRKEFEGPLGALADNLILYTL